MKTGKSIQQLKKEVPKNELAHDALSDCLFQIAYVCHCYTILMNKT